jgi:hypothetical protein
VNRLALWPLLTGADLSALKPGVAVRTADAFRTSVIWCALAMLVAFHAVSLLWRLRGVPGDRLLLALAHLLVGLGFVVMLTRPDGAARYLPALALHPGRRHRAGCVRRVVPVKLDRPAIRELSYVPLVLALLLSVLLIVFGSGPGSSQAKVNLGPFQPIEAIRLLMALFLAGFFARRWELIRQARAGVNLPRLAHVLPWSRAWARPLVLFFFQKDLGPALLLSLMFLSMFAVARGGGWIAGRRARDARGRFRGGLPAEHFEHARRAGRDVAVALGQRRARRRSDRAGDVGARCGRFVGHRRRTRANALRP